MQAMSRLYFPHMVEKLICLLGCWCMGSAVGLAQAFVLYNTGAEENGDFQASGGVCLMGGASESDEAMVWFLERAGGGDVVVLRTSGSDGYNDYMFNDLGVNIHRVTTVVCQSVSASYNEDVLTLVEGAEAIWFAGGDQSTYHNYWQGTPLNEAINDALTQRNVVVGGTSAGMAILGGLRFTAQNGTVNSGEALDNPYNPDMTLDNSPFLDVPLLANTFTDTHFDSPDRRGRLFTFLARAAQDWGISATAIACDEYTAVCIGETGLARVFGGAPQYNDNAYILTVNCELDVAAPEVCNSGQPLTWDQGQAAVNVWRAQGTVSGTPSYNLVGYPTSDGGFWERWWAVDGTFSTEDVEGDFPCAFNPSSPCTFDLDMDGLIATSDVMLLLSEFGCHSECTFNVDGDSSVGVSDVLALLGQFGETC